MPGRCFEKYGNEWSEELTKVTRELLAESPLVMMKNIDRKRFAAFVDLVVLGEPKAASYRAAFPESYNNERYFLRNLKGGEKPFLFYNSIDEIIDDGWAAD